MAKKLYGGTEIKPLETMMNRFVMDYSVDITTAFNGLLDYIIGYFDPTGAPIEGWPFKQEQNKRMHEMMYQYIQIMDEQLAHKQWFDAWGDLFMALYANGADKNQFFTPPSLVNIGTSSTTRRAAHRAICLQVTPNICISMSASPTSPAKTSTPSAARCRPST